MNSTKIDILTGIHENFNLNDLENVNINKDLKL